MRNISSTVLSLAAMVLSSLTTYLTFFDSRYTLTAAVAQVSSQTNRGYSSGNGQRSISFPLLHECNGGPLQSRHTGAGDFRSQSRAITG